MTDTSMTLACPEHRIADANNLAMVLGEGPLDGQTFGTAHWQTPQGARYALARFKPALRWQGVQDQVLARPAWDGLPYRVNMAGALRAQDALMDWDTVPTGNAALPEDRILILHALCVADVLDRLGLVMRDPTQP
ncbi:hypothetical protein ROE7235_01746 [Roseibaca ekhonensis]|uniref:Uncharacterized protein n=1 Tax=Roseinatronobacter ekhonensis TaxID=254356 RepID=A0A3B0M7N0_9RHOB|nr:hypothetical protein [Roseibaca ekhonensis]SUZ31995.1 hypothetical protein ROE7235_01746 [Roseibaca ekhonensis]